MLGDQGRQAACRGEASGVSRHPEIPAVYLLPPDASWPPWTSPVQPSQPLLLTKVGLAGAPLDLHPFGPSLNEKMADQLFQGVP